MPDSSADPNALLEARAKALADFLRAAGSWFDEQPATPAPESEAARDRAESDDDEPVDTLLSLGHISSS